MAKPKVNWFSRTTLTPGDKNKSESISGKFLVDGDNADDEDWPKVTCDPNNGCNIKFEVTQRRGNRLEVEVTVESGAYNGERDLIVETKDCNSGKKTNAFEVKDATEPPVDADDPDDPLQSTKQK